MYETSYGIIKYDLQLPQIFYYEHVLCFLQNFLEEFSKFPLKGE